VARLILINGAPGSGKSTLARRYADEHPLVLVLDIDVVRAMLGRWLDAPGEAGLIARRLALEMARVHLTSGRDVLVPQYLGRIGYVLELERLCRDVGADLVELVLLSDRQDAIDRFERRSRRPETAAHHDASALLARSGGSAELAAMYDRLVEFIAIRPRSITLTTVEGQVEALYRQVHAILDGCPL
jgi:predicted kinase